MHFEKASGAAGGVPAAPLAWATLFAEAKEHGIRRSHSRREHSAELRPARDRLRKLPESIGGVFNHGKTICCFVPGKVLIPARMQSKFDTIWLNDLHPLR
jgi:hypothetical protein